MLLDQMHDRTPLAPAVLPTRLLERDSTSPIA
jgi:hypothetical protein